jgi:heavy metal sensor kinase
MIMQLGRSMENYTRLIEAFRKIFVTTMALLFVLATIVGWFMAKRALAGVETVTRTARRISDRSLDERVPVKKQVDEIDQLALTFNQMLDRIQKLVTEIKEINDNIAHDLKSPITRIRGFAEVSLTSGSSLKEYENMAGNTVEECDRLLDMINTMLLISKTEAGVGRFEEKEIDVARVVRDAAELFSPLAEDGGLTLVCDTPEQLHIRGDIRMIQRMISNLLDNAVKYTPAGGKIEVSSHSDNGQSVRLVVKDTGFGISEEALPHIFERFFRCDPSRSQPGTGLGLSFARAVARAHGGDITVTSRLHQGSTFTVILPKASADAIPKPPRLVGMRT